MITLFGALLIIISAIIVFASFATPTNSSKFITNLDVKEENLAVEFTTWLRKNKFGVFRDGKWYSVNYNRDWRGIARMYTEEELYEYWYNKIYKNETLEMDRGETETY